MTALILFFFLFPLPFLLWNIIDPRGMWEKLSSWQFRDPEANEPSDAAFDMQRLISLISLSVLVVGSLGLFSVVHRSADARSTLFLRESNRLDIYLCRRNLSSGLCGKTHGSGYDRTR